MTRLTLATGLVATLLLVGCSKYSGPYRICLESHNETYTYPILVGKTTIIQTGIREVCDKHTVEQFIKKDKTIYRVEEAWSEN